MNLSFKKSLIGAVLVSLMPLTVLSVGAQGTQTEIVPPGAKVVTEVISEVSIYNATTTKQNGHTLVLDFDLINHSGVDSNVYYGVALAKKNGDTLSVVDHKAYTEKITLYQGKTVHKTITYVVPESLSGDFSLMLFAKNSRGLTLAARPMGTIHLQKSVKGSLYVDQASCSTVLTNETEAKQYHLDELFSINKKSKDIVIKCTVTNTTNNTLTVTPRIISRLRSSYGELVTSVVGPSDEKLSPQESKVVTVTIPKAERPQSYHVEVSFYDEAKKVQSNIVFFKYLVEGVGGSIRTVTLDKDVYNKGDTAIVSFLWTPFDSAFIDGSSTNRGDKKSLSNVSAKFSLINGEGVPCGQIYTQPLTTNDHLIKIPIAIEKDCVNFTVKIDISDQVLGSLDALSLPIISNVDKAINNDQKNMATPVIIFSLLVIVSLITLVYKKRMNTALSSKSVGTALFILALFGLYTSPTYAVGVNLFYVCSTMCPAATTIFMNADLDRPSYTPGQTVNVIFYTSSDDNPQPNGPPWICLFGEANVNSGPYSVDAFPSCYTPSDLRGWGVTGNVVAGVAPSVTGTYNMAGASNGYGWKTSSGVLPVVAAPPTVNINFSRLDSLSSPVFSFFNKLQKKLKIESAFAGERE